MKNVSHLNEDNAYSPSYLLTYLPTYLPIYLLTDLPTHLLTDLPTYLLTYLTYLPTLLTYLITCLNFLVLLWGRKISQTAEKNSKQILTKFHESKRRYRQEHEKYCIRILNTTGKYVQVLHIKYMNKVIKIKKQSKLHERWNTRKTKTRKFWKMCQN